MNVVSSRGGHPPLRDEEALVVETAVRLAIDSIINVLHGVHGARSREHQRTVAERDKEIRRLEDRLTQLEQELQGRRCHGCCTCGVYGAGPGPRVAPPRGVRSSAANRPELEPELELELELEPELEPGCRDLDAASDQQQCDMNISFGLFGGPPSHASSPGRLLLLDQSCSSRASSSEVTVPTPPSSLLVKEEPCDIDAVLIKWEMSEERGGGGGGGGVDRARSLCQHVEGHNEKRKLSSMQKEEEEEENPESAPGGVTPITEEELEVHRNKKRSVPMSELPEEAQRLKRAAWRAASRRYYARKVARQQANPSRRGAFAHITNCGYSAPVPPVPSGSFMERRRATLISQLPEESQTLQREAWRASSRRYYARKVARHQAQAAPYRHLTEDANPSGDVRGPEGGGAHSGGILCS